MKQPLRIIIVRDRASAGGGIANYYRVVTPYLSVKVSFQSVGRPHRYYGEEKSFCARFTILRLFTDWLGLIWKIMVTRPHLVHLNPGLDGYERRALRRDAVNLLIARFFRRPVLVFWRGWHNDWCGQPEFPGGKHGWLCRCYQKAAAHVVLARRFQDDLRRWGFQAPVYVESTAIGDECLGLPITPAPRETDGLRLLYLSRVETAKGIFELVEAYQTLKRRRPGCRLTIAGDGPQLQALKDRVAVMKLKDVVFTGLITGDERTRCYADHDVFCFFSYTEGMPNAVLEAMAMGLAVVASNAGALQEILRNGETGYVLSSRPNTPIGDRFDRQEIADAIEKLQDREHFQRIARHNRRYARERFAADRVAERLGRIYQEVVRLKSDGGRPVAQPSLRSCAE